MYKLYNPATGAKPGDILMVPIPHILETWVSGDGGSPEVYQLGQSKWDRVLIGKRLDYYYEDIVQSLKNSGFKCPLTAQVPDVDNFRHTYSFSDGHHRLAAAIELNMTHVPIKFTEYWTATEYVNGSY